MRTVKDSEISSIDCHIQFGAFRASSSKYQGRGAKYTEILRLGKLAKIQIVLFGSAYAKERNAAEVFCFERNRLQWKRILVVKGTALPIAITKKMADEVAGMNVNWGEVFDEARIEVILKAANLLDIEIQPVETEGV